MRPDLLATSLMPARISPLDAPALLAILGVLVAALIVFLFVRTLRTQVKTRTAELERRASEIEDLNAQLEISNEELQTSKEELQSANEELTLLNADLEAHNRELSDINEELSRLKEFRDRVIATLPAALLVVDRARRVLAANRQYEEAAFVETADVVGHPIEAALPHDMLRDGGLLDAVREVLDTGRPVRLTNVLTCDAHDDERRYDVTVAPLIQTEPGNEAAAQYLLALVDVTDKHRLGRAVREQERYLRRLVENPLVGIVTCTPDWKIDLFNEGAERLTGCTSGEMTGRDVASFLVEGWEASRQLLELRRPVRNIEAVARDRDGAPVPVQVCGVPLENDAGEPSGYLIISTDLRERKAMEENLRRANREMAVLYDVARSLNRSLELDDLITAALDRLADAFPPDTVSCVALPADDPETLFEVLPAREGALRGGKDGRRLLEHVLRRLARDETPLVVANLLEDPATSSLVAGEGANGSCLAIPLHLRGDSCVGALVLVSRSFHRFTDEEVSLLSSVGQSMAAAISNVKLFNDLKGTLADLKQAQDQLLRTEKLRSLGELAAGVAHDFNNILGIILGTAQCLLEVPSDAELQDGLRAIEQAAKDGARTVERVQEFVSAKGVEGFQPIDLNAIVRELAQIARTRLKRNDEFRGVRVELKCVEGRVEPVGGDQRELREALTNIVFNAIDAMPDGGTLTIETGQEGGRMFVRIADTGIGMNAEVRSRMFDPFFTTKGIEGTGLGMSVTYGIVKRHRGTISVESEPGRGTVVAISLPKATETLREAPEAAQAPARAERPVHVLIIDDNVKLTRIMQEILTKAGHDVQIAHDGAEGLEAFRHGHHELVITDIGMPKMSGWQVAQAVKEQAPQTGVILVTGWGKDAYQHEVDEASVDALLPKPIDRAKLLDVLHRTTSKHTA
jgi:PAS domain S-box-containing protein